MARFAGIDIGTTGVKALVADEFGTVESCTDVPYETSRPQPDWSEQNPDDWWAATEHAVRALRAESLDCLGLTGQMHGAVFLDASLNVVRPAILWNDQRTTAEAEKLESEFGALIRRETLNPPLTGFQLPKILWLKNNEPESYRRVRHVLLPKDYIRLKLTGVLATDPSDASGTGVFNVARREWSSAILDALDVQSSWFPPVVESAEISGRTPSGIAVCGGAGDQAAAATGVGCIDPLFSSICLGTSGVVFKPLANIVGETPDSVHRFCHANGGWHTMGVVLSCGGAVKWFRDTFCPGATFDELAALAETVPPGSRGLTFLPYLSGERCPYVEPEARASFVRATAAHGMPEFARAVFEGATFAIWGAANAVGLDRNAMVRVTGGGARSDFWMQLLADSLKIGCVRMEVDEGPAFGAALLGAVSVGAFESVAQAAGRSTKERQKFTPGGIDYGAIFERAAVLHDLNAVR